MRQKSVKFASKMRQKYAEHLRGRTPFVSQRQSITQKGVHTRALTAREREHWFLQHLSHFIAVNFGRQ